MTASTRLDETEKVIEAPNFPLRVVDGLTLLPEYRKALRPGSLVCHIDPGAVRVSHLVLA